ncbi:nicotinamide N-methyltransferase-like isoform X1 [Engystomops pustulosus]|uniref:nicotinamide N-methyltransferase-like isoform X1 n=1 Tax=Engystomops pustulosus TaxID=76066 RepID=UPI003AFA4CBD
MDPGSLKHYHEHEFDPQDLLNDFALPDTDKTLHEEIFLFPMKTLQTLTSSGKIAGKTLIDFSSGPVISHLLPIFDYFSDVIILETNDFCMREMEKWRKKEEEAFDWSHLLEHFSELEGDSKKWIEKEETLRRKIKNMMICDLSKQDPPESLALPKADCLMSFYLLSHICKDKEAYSEIIKHVSCFLNVGGYLILAGAFNVKYFSIGEHKYHSLTMDEEYLRKALEDGGFYIENLEKLDSKLSSSLNKYDQVFLASAVKVREPASPLVYSLPAPVVYSLSTPYSSGGEPMARVPEVALRALSMGTRAITPLQISPDRTQGVLQSQAAQDPRRKLK